LMSPILANPMIKPDRAAIIGARDYFKDLLEIRADTPLFRLRTGQEVNERVKFHNTGPQQVAGVIAMTIDGRGYPNARYSQVAALFNVDKVAREVTVDELKGRTLTIHKTLQKSSGDPLAKTATFNSASGTFRIPPRTTVVFVE
jgi:pullulanase